MNANLTHSESKLVTEAVLSNDPAALQALFDLGWSPATVEALARLIRKEAQA